MDNNIVVIPVRMASKRFPGKPLINIKGKSMVSRVWESAVKANVGDVLVACCDKQVKEHLEEKKIPNIMTKKNLRSGTDRVYSALQKSGMIHKYNYIINLQGDLPNISFVDIRKLVLLIRNKRSKMATLVTRIKEEKKIIDKNIVKVALSKESYGYRAVYFSREAIPYNANKYFEHIGIYAYDKITLKEFVSLKEGTIEKLESLEQLRALENGIKIDANIVNNSPFSIDTPRDLKEYLKKIK